MACPLPPRGRDCLRPATQTSPSGAADQAAWQRVSVVVVFKGGLRKNSTYRHVPETFSPCRARSARSSVRSRGVVSAGGLTHSKFGIASRKVWQILFFPIVNICQAIETVMRNLVTPRERGRRWS
jgi:hypothetical protein